MPEQPFIPDVWNAAQIQSLKELERRNRDVGAREFGAAGFAQILHAQGGPFRVRAEARTVLHYLSPRPTDIVLDAGAGTGRLAVLVAPRVSRLVCADLSGDSLQVLRSEAEARKIHNVETVQSDLCALPDSLGPFDKIYAVEVLEQIPGNQERQIAVRRLYDLLKPGGVCVIGVQAWTWRTRKTDPEKEGFCGTGDRRLYSCLLKPAELGTFFVTAGFREVRLRGLTFVPAKIARRLPAGLAGIETLLSRVPAFLALGRRVIGIAKRRSCRGSPPDVLLPTMAA